MITTFFIGNGFDIGLGLKPSFTDFYDKFQLKCRLPGNEKYKSLAQELVKEKRKIMKSGKEYRWSDFEAFMGDYAGEFDTDSKQVYLDSIDFFSQQFVDYLEYQVEIFSRSQRDLSIMLGRGLLSFETQNPERYSAGFSKKIEGTRYLHHNIGERLNVISFNYTEIMEEQLGLISDIDTKKEYDQSPQEYSKSLVVKSGDIEGQIDYFGHIHGTLKHDPVMGVNDASQIRGKLKYDEDFRRYLLKSELIDVNRNISEKLVRTVIDESNVICIYGCSLGETDKRWWHLILERVAKETSSQLVVFSYKKNVKDDKITGYAVEKEKKKILRKLKRYESAEPSVRQIDVNALNDRIHVALNNNIFSIG